MQNRTLQYSQDPDLEVKHHGPLTPRSGFRQNDPKLVKLPTRNCDFLNSIGASAHLKQRLPDRVLFKLPAKSSPNRVRLQFSDDPV